MTVGSDTLTFTYDASGRPLSITLNGTTYYYVTNLQGDVTAILNTSGTAVVTYTYDAWGNPLTTSGDLATTLGTLNPLRYRGYVYDTETGLYYLQSRYCDPQIGRFINADALVATGQGLLGNNMFAYCLNNPVSFFDRTGTRPQIWRQLFSDHDPGYFHRAVQLHILTTENAHALLFNTEYFISGVGRVDIIDLKNKKMWEIKCGGSSDFSEENAISNAKTQLTKYLKASHDFSEGDAGRFNGAFVVNHGDCNYIITYVTPLPGIILYYVNSYEGEREPSYAYHPYTLHEELKKYKVKTALVPLLPMFMVGAPSDPNMVYNWRD